MVSKGLQELILRMNEEQPNHCEGIDMTVIKECKCEHAYQDKLYGKGRRVFNLTNKGNANKEVHRCSICNREK